MGPHRDPWTEIQVRLLDGTQILESSLASGDKASGRGLGESRQSHYCVQVQGIRLHNLADYELHFCV